MFDHKHYVPILKWKRGEYIALENLGAEIKQKITPLIELVQPDWDIKAGTWKKSIDDHLNKFHSLVQRTWGVERPIFVDGCWLDKQFMMKSRIHPIEWILMQGNTIDLGLIPVIRLSDSAEYQKAVKIYHHRTRSGFCVRLSMFDLESSDFTTNIDAFVKSLGAKQSEVDIILDLRSLYGIPPSVAYQLMVLFYGALPHPSRWRTLITAGSGFPVDLTPFTPGIHQAPRSEWLAWKTFLSNPKSNRLPTFGDYTIQHPDLPSGKFVTNTSASIRYTAKTEWVIFRGRGVNSLGSGGRSQYKNQCQLVVAHPSYAKPAFSYGDQYIADCSTGNASTGNAETWRRVGTNHHITFVVKQLANYFSSSNKTVHSAGVVKP